MNVMNRVEKNLQKKIKTLKTKQTALPYREPDRERWLRAIERRGICKIQKIEKIVKLECGYVVSGVLCQRTLMQNFKNSYSWSFLFLFSMNEPHLDRCWTARQRVGSVHYFWFIAKWCFSTCSLTHWQLRILECVLVRPYVV